MSETQVSLNVVEDGGWADSMPLLLLALCLTIGVIAFLYGARWLLHRRRAARNDHLVVDMAEPETLRDLPDERKP